MRTLEIARESGESALASATEARAAAGDARSEAGTRTGEISDSIQSETDAKDAFHDRVESLVRRPTN
jgi:hypothetical protein